jgi:hypothetical protein
VALVGSNEGDLEAMVQSSQKSGIHPEKLGTFLENATLVNYHFTIIKANNRAELKQGIKILTVGVQNFEPLR